MSALSNSKLIIVPSSAASARARSAASRSIRSRSRRSRSALWSTGAGGGGGAGAGAGSGAGSSGGEPPPQAASAKEARSSKEEARIITPSSWVRGDRGPAEAPGPRRKPGRSWRLELPYPAGFGVDDPDLPPPGAVGNERDVTAVGAPGRILVAARRGELGDATARDIHQEDLRAPGDVAVEDDSRPVRRPLRRVGGAGRTVVERRQQLLIGAVHGHHVDLGRARARGHERDASAVGGKGW